MRLAPLLAVGLAACAPTAFHKLPTPEELNRASIAELYASYPELAECGPDGNAGSASALSTRSANSLIGAWGEPDETSLSAWNLMVWMIPIAPVTTWEWTRFERPVEITVWHPAVRGYRPAVWMCDFGPLRVR